MDNPKLPVGFLEAGREYNASLRALGLRAEMVTWGFDFDIEAFQLVVVWGGVDKFGPLAVTQLLFDAYNASALPKEIDPFSVIAVGLKNPVATTLNHFRTEKDSKAFQMSGKTPSATGDIDPQLHLEREWIVSMAPKPKSSLEVNKDWRRFSQTVASLAAA